MTDLERLDAADAACDAFTKHRRNRYDRPDATLAAVHNLCVDLARLGFAEQGGYGSGGTRTAALYCADLDVGATVTWDAAGGEPRANRTAWAAVHGVEVARTRLRRQARRAGALRAEVVRLRAEADAARLEADAERARGREAATAMKLAEREAHERAEREERERVEQARAAGDGLARFDAIDLTERE